MLIGLHLGKINKKFIFILLKCLNCILSFFFGKTIHLHSFVFSSHELTCILRKIEHLRMSMGMIEFISFSEFSHPIPNTVVPGIEDHGLKCEKPIRPLACSNI